MEEKILIQSNNNYAKQLKHSTGIILIVSLVIFLVLMAFFNSNKYTILAVLDITVFVVALGLFIFAIMIANTSLTVSNKRAYGRTIFGKRVDLPLDSISAVGVSMFKGIAIGTSSGRIVFKGIGNRDDIHGILSKLLIERQGQSTVVTTTKQEIPQSAADELKKYKELLDSDVISQEEFDAKKKQLLGL